MCKNLVTQLIYRVVLCVVSAFACLLSLGIFYIGVNGGNTFSWGFLKFYTNISNYFVLAVSIVVLADTVRRVRRGETEGYNEKLRTFKFMTVVMILVTFLVVIFLLDSPLHASYWRNIGNMAYHFLAPLLFILDYIFFDEKRTLSVLAPLYSLVIPLVYVAYIFLLGAIVPDFEYPYFFLDVNTLGYGGVLLWILGLLVVFAALGYLLWLWNRLYRADGKWKFDFRNILFPQKKGGAPAEEPSLNIEEEPSPKPETPSKEAQTEVPSETPEEK